QRGRAPKQSIGRVGAVTATRQILKLNNAVQVAELGERSLLLTNATQQMTQIYHFDDTPVVALSTGWFNKKSRCLNNFTINANGRSMVAMVVDECDSTMGCDSNHDYGLHVLITLLMFPKLRRKHWVCLVMIGADWILHGPMLKFI
ncbi:ripening-related protein grip22, partial [Quercus suber]